MTSRKQQNSKQLTKPVVIPVSDVDSDYEDALAFVHFLVMPSEERRNAYRPCQFDANSRQRLSPYRTEALEQQSAWDCAF
jgi:hypothetical protein